jgi:hypothetical protein
MLVHTSITESTAVVKVSERTAVTAVLLGGGLLTAVGIGSWIPLGISLLAVVVLSRVLRRVDPP